MLIYQGEEMEEDDETMADYSIQVKDNANTNAVIIIDIIIINTMIIGTFTPSSIFIDTIITALWSR